MFCKKCGKELDDSVSLCGYCGAPTVEVNATESNSCSVTITARKSHFYQMFMPKLWIEFNDVKYKIKCKKSVTIDVVPGQYKVYMYFKRRILLLFHKKGGKKQLSLPVRNGEHWDIEYKYPFFIFSEGKTTTTKRQ